MKYQFLIKLITFLMYKVIGNGQSVSYNITHRNLPVTWTTVLDLFRALINLNINVLISPFFKGHIFGAKMGGHTRSVSLYVLRPQLEQNDTERCIKYYSRSDKYETVYNFSTNVKIPGWF